MTFEQIEAQDQAYILHTYGRVDAALVKGRNARAWDVDGKEYIDFTAGIGVNALGYSDPEWTAAVAEQAGKIQHMCNYYYCPENTALAQELSRASGMAKAFFCNSGAEANECAVKVARKYGEKRGAYKIVTLINSFHGRTLTTLAATGQAEIRGVNLPALKLPCRLLMKAGARIEKDETADALRISMKERPRGLVIETAPYPGFPTDLQSPFMAFLAGAKGESRIRETVFEDRFATAGELRKMGARIRVQGREAEIKGVWPLMGTKVQAKDLRGGAALVAAALGAGGETVIENCGYIERGYEDICRDLAALGARIRRI